MRTWAVRYGWLTTVLATWLLVLAAITSTLADDREQRVEAKSVPVELRAYVEQFTGPRPVDCGHSLGPLAVRSSEAEELRVTASCGYIAARGRTPFCTFNQIQGSDSLVFSGLLGTREGIIFRFSYDSASCVARGAQKGSRSSVAISPSSQGEVAAQTSVANNFFLGSHRYPNTYQIDPTHQNGLGRLPVQAEIRLAHELVELL